MDNKEDNHIAYMIIVTFLLFAVLYVSILLISSQSTCLSYAKDGHVNFEGGKCFIEYEGEFIPLADYKVLISYGGE